VTSLPDDSPAPVVRALPDDRRRVLARKWVYLLSLSSYLALPHTEMERELQRLVTHVFDAMVDEPMPVDRVAEIGARLVELHCVGKASLRCTMEVLAGALLSDPEVQRLDRLPERVVQLLGALASGYADAVRSSTMEQQDNLHRALLEFNWESEQKLAWLRDHDAYTGLPNRECFLARLTEALDAGRPVTVYALEVDGFPLLTNGFGRSTADGVVREVGHRLLDLLADKDDVTVARVDGATFAVLTASAPDTGSVIRGIRGVLADPVQVGALRTPVSVSIGVVHQRPDQTDPAALMQAAELALRRAGARGNGQWALYDRDRDDRDRETLALAATMPHAWESGQFRVTRHPAVRLSDNMVVGVEAQVAWSHPVLGSIPYQQCQELAECAGLSLPLASWLLRRACEQVRRSRLPVHVPLTGGQSADRELVVRVRQALTDTSLPPARLRIGMPMAELRADRGGPANVRGLTEIGVRVVAHHVGGSPEDVAQLDKLGIRVAHLGPSLVDRQAQRSSQLVDTAVTGLITLLHQAGCTVVVDNLRTAHQVHWWRTAGADTGSGPIFNRRR
jgi:diguanylate cyclase (GGDEF)-like protein